MSTKRDVSETDWQNARRKTIAPLGYSLAVNHRKRTLHSLAGGEESP
jgi:hypothetical protein